MAWGTLAKQGIDPYADFRPLRFTEIHDAVVMAVLRGEVDAGSVRTDILERMAAEGIIQMSDIRVLNPQSDPEFPFVRSTPLYPEWPFGKLRKTPNALAQQVHKLLETLHLPPYNHAGRFTLRDAMRRYWVGLLLSVLALVVMAALTARVLRLNRRLARAKAHVEQQQELVLNSVAEGIYGVGLDGRTRFINAAMERITGWSADELIGSEHHKVIHHTKADGSPYSVKDCPIYATFRDNRPRFVDDDLFWRKDGASFPVEYSSNPISSGIVAAHGGQLTVDSVPAAGATFCFRLPLAEAGATDEH